MLKLRVIIPAVLIVLAGCSRGMYSPTTGNLSKSANDSLYVVLNIKPVLTVDEKINLKFVVHNKHAMGKSFCKWHTPFEPLSSNYLSIRDESGNEVPYVGPMAKRIIPADADSYLVVNPKDTLATEVNIMKSYLLKAGRQYSVSYNSSRISGLKATNTVTFKIQD